MKRITRQEAEKILNSHYPNFVSAMKTAYQDWKEIVTRYPNLSARTRACVINDQIRSYIRDVYDGNDSCNIITPKGSFFLKIQDSIAARFKMLKGSLPSNIATIQSTQIEMQQLTLGEQLDSPTIVNVGYVPDRSWSKFRYEISCAIGKRIVWVLDMTSEIEEEKPVVIEEVDIQQTEIRKKRVYKKAQ